MVGPLSVSASQCKGQLCLLVCFGPLLTTEIYLCVCEYVVYIPFVYIPFLCVYTRKILVMLQKKSVNHSQRPTECSEVLSG